jgi:WhiB family redox-sensing transcriptional regulator
MSRTPPVPTSDRHAWHLQAACRGEFGSAFYPPAHAEGREEKLHRERAAKAVCAGCPVQVECLDHAVTHDERHGIWGGLTDAERRHLRRSA